VTGARLLVAFDPDRARSGIDAWLAHLDTIGAQAVTVAFGGTTVILASGLDPGLSAPAGLPAPSRIAVCPGELRLAGRELRPAGTVVSIGAARIGDGRLSVFAGPCAVEDRDQLMSTAQAVAGAGVVGLRGGAFKPRTSPYSFQGLRWAGLRLLAEARERVSLPVLTEVVDPRHVRAVAEIADGLQIGARNMQNFALLSEVGKTGRPVVLKRGFGCTVEELLAAAEYILLHGNDQVVLCERGIRNFDTTTRFTLDLAAVAVLKQRSHLPVMVDPSHALGVPSLVEPMALAAAATGADALLIDVHVQPERALCDGNQALPPPQFRSLMTKLELLAAGVGRQLARPGPGGEAVRGLDVARPEQWSRPDAESVGER
jgi:3-deoxy-7-phosphoheptulonate synthase